MSGGDYSDIFTPEVQGLALEAAKIAGDVLVDAIRRGDVSAITAPLPPDMHPMIAALLRQRAVAAGFSASDAAAAQRLEALKSGLADLAGEAIKVALAMLVQAVLRGR